jgi:hypothetical protein
VWDLWLLAAMTMAGIRRWAEIQLALKPFKVTRKALISSHPSLTRSRLLTIIRIRF